jgi:hypothetical protein
MSVWQRGRVSGQTRRWALGMWLPQHKLASPAYTPTPRARLGLRYKKPVFYTITIVLGAGETGRGRVSVAPNFRLLSIMAQASQPSAADGGGSFTAQIFDPARRQAFSQVPVPNGTIFGNAQNPFILKYPYRFSGTTPAQVTVQNRTNAANTVTIVLYGVSD